MKVFAFIQTSIVSVLTALLATIVITGGTWLHIGKVKLDLSSAGAWALLLLLLLLLDQRFGGAQSVRLKAFVSYFTDSPRAWLRSLTLFATLLFLLFVAHTLRHWSLNTQPLDHVLVHQALRDTLRCDFCPGGTFLSAHLSFIFAPVSLLTLSPWLRWPDE